MFQNLEAKKKRDIKYKMTNFHVVDNSSNYALSWQNQEMVSPNNKGPFSQTNTS
jgi:hypothetical protein